MITTVTIAGVVLDPCYVLSHATVIHGRGGFGEQGQPSSATVAVEYPPGVMPPWKSGDTITLAGPNGQAFTGRIVQRTLTHTDNQGGVFAITAAGPLAALGVRKIGDTPWPQETGTTRAARILTAAGTPWLVDGVEDLVVLPRDVDAQPALVLLDDLIQSTRAAVFDTPTGEVVYQALSARGQVFPYQWQDFPPGDTWATFDPALTWDGAPPSIGQWPSPASQFPVVVPCTAVEWAPEWSTSEAAVINHVRVGWGLTDPQAVVELEDAASITAHNRRYLYAGTTLATVAGANDLAAHIITTQAEERWQIGDVIVALEQLDPTTYARVLALRCGDEATLQGLPQPAPAIEWTGIVEGWTFTQWGNAGVITEQMVLALSDPLMSLVVPEWQDYPSLYQWDQHPTATTWNDLNTPASIGA